MAAADQCPPSTPNLPALPLPEGITSSYIRTPSLTYHILSSGAPTKENQTKKPLILLLHGFPELAYSWRKIMPSLATLEPNDPTDHPPGSSCSGADDPMSFEPSAKDGYHVVAYDQRGYGRTTGWDTRPYHDVDLNTFRMTEVVKDAVRLVYALGYEECACIVGHDFGAVGAALAAVIRPDVFKKVVLMSHPFTGIPAFPLGTNEDGVAAESEDKEIETCLRELAQLPEPRKHYKWYYSSPGANAEMTRPKQGLKAFLRGYFYLKSGASHSELPEEFGLSWRAEDLATMPGYYVMPLHKTMSETIADDLAAQHTDGELWWMTEEELDVYVAEYARTGFQGGLNYYRVGTSREWQSDLEVFRGKKLEIPSTFICGERDWGYYQTPGAVDKMWSEEVCSNMRGTGQVITNVGHWTMQEDDFGTVLSLIHAHLENRVIELGSDQARLSQ